MDWIKKYLDNENQGKCKIFLNRELKNQGNELTLISNLSKKDMAKYLNISDPFLKEICETWVEINYEDKIASTEQFQSQYLWLNSLIRIGNQPVHYKNWVDKGILKIKHIMKNSSQFLTHDELQNKYDLKVCPLAYCGIITAIKKMKAKIALNTNSYESLSTRLCKSKEPSKMIYKMLVIRKSTVPFKSQCKISGYKILICICKTQR